MSTAQYFPHDPVAEPYRSLGRVLLETFFFVLLLAASFMAVTGTAALFGLDAPKRIGAEPAPPEITNPISIIAGPNYHLADEIPEALVPIFQTAAAKHKVSVHLVAAIFWMEHGRRFPTTGPWASSSAGASGPFQFIPSTWAAYGDDCSGDGAKDIQNLQDAACGAASYLAASGARIPENETDVPTSAKYRAAISYNHADWYASSVVAKEQDLLAQARAKVGRP
jgi:hypothetical protein